MTSLGLLGRKTSTQINKDDISKYYFYLFPENRTWHFKQSVKPYFLEKLRKPAICHLLDLPRELKVNDVMQNDA